MGLSKYLWNKIKKEAEIELEGIKKETTKLEDELNRIKAAIETEETKLEKIRVKDYDYFSYYKQVFESPNQYIVFLHMTHLDIIKDTSKALVRYYREHIGSINVINSRTYFKTIADFAEFDNSWNIHLPDEPTLFYPLAIGFDQKISGDISINYGRGYENIYKIHFQNESWSPLFGHRQSPLEFIPIINEVRIKSPAKPVLYVVGILRGGDDS